ncbi:hypothetical protein [Deinococcus sp. JMULE3]|uniref:hypothetical protein n=1 Tax=Deinococcus sp. JMULE3 TaxID=2518341 RepID=UPI0015777C15|nr:hypothetical protein [Deinococcus sp. JMULE3]NTX98849.1 hypothetical protein [Deinococcus sp. JMULE3]
MTRRPSRLLLLALLLTGAYHGVLVLTRAGLKSAQAAEWLFLASAYARAPLDPFDDRWYGGVPLTGESPLLPQLIAALSGQLGLDGGYAAAQFLAVVTLLYGTYRFALLVGAGPRGAGVAALLTLLGSALTLSVSVFGQLGAVLGAGLALNAAPTLHAWVSRARTRDLLGWTVPLVAAAAAHSAAPLLLLGTLALTLPAPRQPRRRALQAALAVPAALILLAVPDHAWVGPTTRVPIPDLREGRSIWLTWGLPLLSVAWVMPTLLRAARTAWDDAPGPPLRRAAVRWAAAPDSVRAALTGTVLLLAALTSLLLPVPWRAAPETLTLLGTLLLTPLAALVALSGWDAARRTPRPPLPLLISATLVILGTVSMSALNATRVLEGPPLNLTPLLNFIEKDEHWRYRYLTVGFGTQLGLLSAQTRAATPAGLWHVPPDLPQPFAPPGAAGALPERLDVPGQGRLAELLTHPERSYLKFVYARSDVMDPLLYAHGWHNIGTLENGVNVWEREDIPPVPARLARPALPIPLGALWGTLPLLALAGSLLLLPLGAQAWRTDPHLPGAVVRSADLIRVPLLLLGAGLLLLLAQAYRPAWAAQRHLATLPLATSGGLRGAYSRLDRAQVRITRTGPGQAVAQVNEHWWTPLGVRLATRRLDLTLWRGGWQVSEAGGSALTLRPPVLSPQPDVTFYRAPRRITTNVTAPADVLDRPVLKVLPGRLTRDARGHVWYLTEVLCADARPADLTVTVILRVNGERVAEENAGLLAQHKLRSGERSPLRVRLPLPDTVNLDDPRARAALSVEVSARAVVTGRHLERPLVSRSRVRAGRVEVQARNASSRAVATPVALLTLFDARGVSWVYAAAGPELPPGATWTFTLPATPPPHEDLLDVAAPALTDLATVQPRAVPPGTFPLPGGGQYRLTFVTLPAPERP